MYIAGDIHISLKLIIFISMINLNDWETKLKVHLLYSVKHLIYFKIETLQTCFKQL